MPAWARKTDHMSTAGDVHSALLGLGATVATAESLTGGRLAALLTETPGASDTYRGGFVTYATELKQDLLGVPSSVIRDHGVVSAECALAMADGARKAAGSTYAVSTTGVAGPGPQDGVPAGRVYVAVCGPDGSTAFELNLTGSRSEVQEQTCGHALSELRGLLRREDMRLE